MELARAALGILTVFGLLGILVWIGRGKGIITAGRRSGPGPRLMVQLERLPLTANHSVHLLRAGDRTLLVGAHATGLVVLADLSKDTTCR